MPQTNPKVSKYAVPALGAPPLILRCTTWPKFVGINEDPAYNAGVGQGLSVYFLDPAALSTNILLNAEGPAIFPPSANGIDQLTVGDQHNIHSGTSQPLGNPGSGGNIDNPGGSPTLGTPLLAINSNTVNPSGIIVREYA